MLINYSTKAAAPVAKFLTREKMAITPKNAAYPVAVMAGHYTPAEAPRTITQRLSADDFDALTHYVAKANDYVHPLTEEDFDDLVTLQAGGLQRMLYTAQQVIAPVTRETMKLYQGMAETHTAMPSLKVEPLVFADVHNDPEMVNAVYDTYSRYRLQPTYRTFTIRESIPLLYQDFLDWLRECCRTGRKIQGLDAWVQLQGEELYHGLFVTLFGERRELSPNQIDLFYSHRRPTHIDEILLMLLITEHLRDHPQDPRGESVDLETYREVLTQLMEMIGIQLCENYKARETARKNQRLVFAIDNSLDWDSVSGLAAKSLCVTVNSDLFSTWIERGGQTEALLALGVDNLSIRSIPDINAQHEALVKRWQQYYARLQARVQAEWVSYRRHALVTVVEHLDASEIDAVGNLPELPVATIRKRARDVVATFRDGDLDDSWRVTTKLVCEVFYPNTPYHRFLYAMDQLAEKNPQLPAREIASLATMEMVVQWLRDQMEVKQVDVKITEEGESTPASATPEEA